LNVSSISVSESSKAQLKMDLLHPSSPSPTQSYAEICRRLIPLNVGPLVSTSRSGE
jgi:hypothetical protein